MLNPALTLLLNEAAGHLAGTRPLPPKRAQQVAAALQDLLVADATARQQASARAAARPRQQGAGRPPSTTYAVALGDQWAQHVLGARAAHELVKETLTQHGMRAPGLQSLQVALARAGQWACTVPTASGAHVLHVAKVAESA